MNMVIELNALSNRYSFMSFTDTYEVVKLARGFVRKYGGRVTVYSSSHSTIKKHGYMKVKIMVEFCCKLRNEDDIADFMYYYVPLELERSVRDEAHLQIVLDEIQQAING